MMKMINAFVVRTSLTLIGFNAQTKINVEDPVGITLNVQESQLNLKTLINQTSHVSTVGEELKTSRANLPKKDSNLIDSKIIILILFSIYKLQNQPNNSKAFSI